MTPGELVLWLRVVPSTPNVVGGTLWTKNVCVEFAPHVGDHIILWGGGEDPLDGPKWPVVSRWWDARPIRAVLHVELATMVVDPRRAFGENPGPYSPFWGDPTPLLEAGHWLLHDPQEVPDDH